MVISKREYHLVNLCELSLGGAQGGGIITNDPYANLKSNGTGTGSLTLH